MTSTPSHRLRLRQQHGQERRRPARGRQHGDADPDAGPRQPRRRRQRHRHGLRGSTSGRHRRLPRRSIRAPAPTPAAVCSSPTPRPPSRTARSSDNKVEGVKGSGGAISFYGGFVSHVVRNCLITGNSASKYGGAIACLGLRHAQGPELHVRQEHRRDPRRRRLLRLERRRHDPQLDLPEEQQPRDCLRGLRREERDHALPVPQQPAGRLWSAGQRFRADQPGCRDDSGLDEPGRGPAVRGGPAGRLLPEPDARPTARRSTRARTRRPTMASIRGRRRPTTASTAALWTSATTIPIPRRCLSTP